VRVKNDIIRRKGDNMIKLTSRDFNILARALEGGEAYFEIIRDKEDVYLNELPVETMHVVLNDLGEEVQYIQYKENMAKGISFSAYEILHLQNKEKVSING
jgi:phage portal protein BeeE